jgi:hypothetical protein
MALLETKAADNTTRTCPGDSAGCPLPSGYDHGMAIDASVSDVSLNPCSRAIRAGSGGTLICEMLAQSGVSLTIPNVAAGELLRIHAIKVKVGTSGVGWVAFW